MVGSIAAFAGAFGVCYQKGVFYSNEYPISKWKKVKIDLNEKPFEIEYSEVELNPVEEELHAQYIAEMVPWAEEKLAGLDMPDDSKRNLSKCLSMICLLLILAMHKYSLNKTNSH